MCKNYINNHPKGTTWYGMELLIEEEVIPATDPKTYRPKDLTGATVVANFRKEHSLEISFIFSSENGIVTIPNPLDALIIFGSQLMNVDAYTYSFDVLLTYANGDVEEVLSNFWKIE